MKCDISGKCVLFGGSISKSNRNSIRVFKPNIHIHCYRIRGVLYRLRLSHYAIRIVNKYGGIDSTILNYNNKNESTLIKRIRKILLRND